MMPRVATVNTVHGKSFKGENFRGFCSWLGNRKSFHTIDFRKGGEEHMVLFKYLKPKKKPGEESLLDPEGPLPP